MFTEQELNSTNIVYMLGQLQAKIDEMYEETKIYDCKMDKVLTLEANYSSLLSLVHELKKDHDKLQNLLTDLEKQVHVVYQIAGYTVSVFGVLASVIGTLEIFFGFVSKAFK